jgi:hypothetical protein
MFYVVYKIQFFTNNTFAHSKRPLWGAVEPSERGDADCTFTPKGVQLCKNVIFAIIHLLFKWQSKFKNPIDYIVK